MADAGNGGSTLAGVGVSTFLVRVHGGAFSGWRIKVPKNTIIARTVAQ